MKVINLFGGPCSGKSTTAAELFVEMKKADLNVELVTEYAKDMVWEKRDNILDDQIYIFAKQHRRLLRLIGRVDWVVTDSPLLFGLIYGNPTLEFANFLKTEFVKFDNRNFCLPRHPDFIYQPTGRVQSTVEEAGLIDRKVRIYMPSGTLTLSTNDNYVDQIIQHLGLPITREIAGWKVLAKKAAQLSEFRTILETHAWVDTEMETICNTWWKTWHEDKDRVANDRVRLSLLAVLDLVGKL